MVMTMMGSFMASVISQSERHEARVVARSMADVGGWLEHILDHHEQIDQALEPVFKSMPLDEWVRAEQHLMVLLAAHISAEELILYPALNLVDHRRAQCAAVQHKTISEFLAQMRILDPTSREYQRIRQDISSAMREHMYVEETDWLLSLQGRTAGTTQSRFARRYKEEFDRYWKLSVGVVLTRP
jgi:hypothetical protein